MSEAEAMVRVQVVPRPGLLIRFEAYGINVEYTLVPGHEGTIYRYELVDKADLPDEFNEVGGMRRAGDDVTSPLNVLRIVTSVMPYLFT